MFRYEYRINFLEEQVRRLTSRQGPPAPPGPAPGPTLSPTPGPSPGPPGPSPGHPILLDITGADTDDKMKELEEKCRDLEVKKSQAELKLREEVEKNVEVKKAAEELKQKESLKLAELEKANADLHEMLTFAGKTDMDLFVMDSDTMVDTPDNVPELVEDKSIEPTEAFEVQIAPGDPREDVNVKEAIDDEKATEAVEVESGDHREDVNVKEAIDDEILEAKRQTQVLEEELANLFCKPQEPNLAADDEGGQVKVKRNHIEETVGSLLVLFGSNAEVETGKESPLEVFENPVKKCRVDIKLLQKEEMEELLRAGKLGDLKKEWRLRLSGETSPEDLPGPGGDRSLEKSGQSSSSKGSGTGRQRKSKRRIGKM